MKKWVVFTALLLACGTSYAENAEKVEALSIKVKLRESTGYKFKNGFFILSDGSCWKAIGLEKRSRTPIEWWYDEFLFPVKYDCLPDDWGVGVDIQIYTKEEYLDVEETNASNYQEIKQCSHFLVNRSNGQVLFAIALDRADGVAQFAKYGYEEGYIYGSTRTAFSPLPNDIALAPNALTVLGLSGAAECDEEKMGFLVSKVTLDNANGVLTLSDGSCWKVIGIEKRKRTTMEWWNNVTIIPKSYECVPREWSVGARIEVYPTAKYLTLYDAVSTIREDINQCTHLLFNTSTQQILFAIALDPVECIKQVYEESFGLGFSHGMNRSGKKRLESDQYESLSPKVKEAVALNRF